MDIQVSIEHSIIDIFSNIKVIVIYSLSCTYHCFLLICTIIRNTSEVDVNFTSLILEIQLGLF